MERSALDVYDVRARIEALCNADRSAAASARSTSAGTQTEDRVSSNQHGRHGSMARMRMKLVAASSTRLFRRESPSPFSDVGPVVREAK
jgi:hypothetical protein